MVVFSIDPGDYINSKEYRKPDWLIAMEALKEKLAGNSFSLVKYNIFYRIHIKTLSKIFCFVATEQAAKFIREIKEVRNKEGMRARFEAVFAGNPKPEVNWYFQGKLLEESANIQIKVLQSDSFGGNQIL